jgi:hypothetical protein
MVVSLHIITLSIRAGMSVHYVRVACYYKRKLFVSSVESRRARLQVYTQHPAIVTLHFMLGFKRTINSLNFNVTTRRYVPEDSKLY